MKECHVTLMSLIIGLVRIAAISVYIDFTDPARTTAPVIKFNSHDAVRESQLFVDLSHFNNFYLLFWRDSWLSD